MTKGGSNKPNVLGRLIFGEKRKQHASPSRHRSATRNVHDGPPVPSSGEPRHKHPINIHDWAVWRMHLNEQMENGSGDPGDFKQVRQFLQSNAFYQQHSRDPSTGRYNGVRLLFSIPHAKVKPELIQPVREISNVNANVKDILQNEQPDEHSNIDDRALTSVHAAPVKPVITTDKTISQLLPKNLIGNTVGFLPVSSEQMIPTDLTRPSRSMRTTYSAADRVHSTLQKAVKDGNVLEKIKAFELQAAAAAQADSTPKLGRDPGIHNVIPNRVQPITSSIPSAAQRTLSPNRSHPIQHPISSPQLMHYDLSSASQQQHSQQQYIRHHRSRYAHSGQQQHRDGSHLRSMMGHESRKGAHVLEPAHGDIILKRRTPSQKTMNDDDYSMTVMSSMALNPSQGHHHRHHHSHYHRSSVSRSRHRQEAGHERRSSSHHDHHAHKKQHHKQKESAKTAAAAAAATTTTNKTSSRRGWLKGRKETSNAETTETSKQDSTTTKSKKNKKNKKNNDKDKSDSTKKATSPDPKDKSATTVENNRVYGVPNTTCNEQTKSEAISSAQPSSHIDDENDTDRDEKNTEIKKLETPLEEEEEEEELEEQEKLIPIKPVEKRINQAKVHQKLPSTEGEILSKVEDETRFSRPTDDHAHRSDFNDDDDDEYKSEGDVFLEEIPPQQHTSNAIERQDSVDEISSDRRWQWSKEIGGLIEKAVHKKKQQPITILTRKNKVNIEEDQQVIYEVPQAEQSSSLSLKKMASFDDDKQSMSDTQISKQLLHSIMNTKKKDSTNLEQSKRDEFFEHGPHTNPEETIVNITSSA